jgi:hypothetical protein
MFIFEQDGVNLHIVARQTSRHGFPGIAVMGPRSRRAREHPCKMIAAQTHWGRSRHRQLHVGRLFQRLTLDLHGYQLFGQT